MIDKIKAFAPAVALSIALAFSAGPVLAAKTHPHSGQSVQTEKTGTDTLQKKKIHKKSSKKMKKKTPAEG